MRENEQQDWELPEYGNDAPTQIEWAMMAAYLDGEGSICIQTRNARVCAKQYANPEAAFYLMITVANTDIRLIIWIIDRFGGSYNDSTSEKQYRDGRKRCFHWTCSANRAAWILYNCLPYFVIKKEQAEIGIQLQETMMRNRGYAKKISPEVISKRQFLKKNLLVLKKRGRHIEQLAAAEEA